MTQLTTFKLGYLRLAIPAQEVVQINLSSDIMRERDVCFISYRGRKIPVCQLDPSLQALHEPSADSDNNFVITLAWADKDLQISPRFALQVNSVMKLRPEAIGTLPKAMLQSGNPLTAWFSTNNERGFYTNGAALEQLINQLTENADEQRADPVANRA